MFESNQGGIETITEVLTQKSEAQFESNQGGIETLKIAWQEPIIFLVWIEPRWDWNRL